MEYKKMSNSQKERVEWWYQRPGLWRLSQGEWSKNIRCQINAINSYKEPIVQYDSLGLYS